jgi:phosphoglycolate phosphatase-like HAD superfamily hydrolase
MQLAIFDIDGTLTESTHADNDCFVEAMDRTFEIRNVDTNWTSYKHSTDSGIVAEILEARFGRLPSGEETARFRGSFCGALEDYFSTHPLEEVRGAKAFVCRLRQDSDWAVAIATGGWRTSALNKLRSTGIEIDGLPLRSSDDAVSRNNILKMVIQDSGRTYAQTRFERIVYLGDASWDLRSARQLQIAFVGVGARRQERLQSLGATHVIADYGDPELAMAALRNATPPNTNE